MPMDTPPQPTPMLADDALLAETHVDMYRGSGPGGQKRNKTSNAVRLTHLPTAIAATATESRSLAENRLRALRRLRLKLSAEIRDPIDLTRFQAPDWFPTIRRGNRLEISHRHPLYPAAGGLLLDLLAALAGNPAAVAVNLGITTTAVVHLLGSETIWWTAANAIRRAAGHDDLQRR